MEDIALDAEGNVHVVASGGGGGGGLERERVYYSNNLWESRGPNGFAPPFELFSITDPNLSRIDIRNHRIAVSPSGLITVVWLPHLHLYMALFRLEYIFQ